jgi:NAD(P)-dependent dehydrogenase (short-subunit alcohol dehydrogenase family)
VEQREIFPITDLDTDYFARLMNVNVVGTFNCIKEEMKVIKDGGSIVNVGSIASNYASAGVSAYVSAKHAIIGYVDLESMVDVLSPQKQFLSLLTKSFTRYHSPLFD